MLTLGELKENTVAYSIQINVNISVTAWKDRHIEQNFRQEFSRPSTCVGSDFRLPHALLVYW